MDQKCSFVANGFLGRNKPRLGADQWADKLEKSFAEKDLRVLVDNTLRQLESQLTRGQF